MEARVPAFEDREPITTVPFGLMRRLLLASALGVASLSTSLMAQIVAPSAPRNIVYAELGGPGGLFSLNYELLSESDFYFRGGAGYWGFTNLDSVHEALMTIVGGATRRFDVSERVGEGEGRIVETGVALVAGTYRRTRYQEVEVDGAYASLVPTFGIRVEPPAGGYSWRLTVTPLIPIVNRASAFPQSSPTLWGGIMHGLHLQVMEKHV